MVIFVKVGVGAKRHEWKVELGFGIDTGQHHGMN